MWKYNTPSLICIFWLAFGAAYAQSQTSQPLGYIPMGSEQTDGIVDLVLIYQGGTHRLDWTKEQFEPYLTWTNPDTQKEEWLYDGFLFIEYMTNTGYTFCKDCGEKPSTKAVTKSLPAPLPEIQKKSS